MATITPCFNPWTYSLGAWPQLTSLWWQSAASVYLCLGLCVLEREKDWKALMQEIPDLRRVLYPYVRVIGCKSGSRLCNNCCCLKCLNHSQLDNKEQSCSIFKQSLNWPCLLTFTSPSSLSVWSKMTVNCAPLRAPLEKMNRFSFCSSTKPPNYMFRHKKILLTNVHACDVKM